VIFLDKIKVKDIKPLRQQFLEEQLGLCALCREPIDATEEVLDHCHRTGYIRAVLHRGCNAYIGAMENNLARNRITSTRLSNILANFERYRLLTKPIIHPTHLTPEERKVRAKKRAKKRRQSNQKD
jgi:hypothetical protein